LAPSVSNAGIYHRRTDRETSSAAPSGLAVYRGDKFPDWEGNLFVGGLVGKRVDRLNSKGEVLGTIPIGARVRDVRQGQDGWLYVLTDGPQGKLLRISR